MESKKTQEELKEILDRNTAWIENCDSKTSIILGSFGVIAGIFLATDYVSKLRAYYAIWQAVSVFGRSYMSFSAFCQ